MRDGVYLSSKAGIILFFWLLVVATCGFLLLGRELLDGAFLLNDAYIFQRALKCGLGTAMLANALFYIRKLYKDLFAQLDGPKSAAASLATLMYFCIRPIFAILFALIIVVSSAAFVHSVTTHESALSVGFVFFSILSSGLAAIVTGRTLKHFEKIAAQSIHKIGSA